MSSILLDVKTMLDIEPSISDFDTELIVFINTAFGILNQIGVGPETPFRITGATETWDSFIGPGTSLNMVQNYVYLKTKTLFDPSTNSNLAGAAESMLDEMSFRMYVRSEVEGGQS